MAFVDAAGGARGGDAYAIAIGHKSTEDRFIIDAVRGRSGPFEPVELTKEYAELCRQYRIDTVRGDRYALEWVVTAWNQAGMHFIHSEKPASELYLESLPLFTRHLVSLPDHPVLLRELRLLERIPTRMGKDKVAHPRGCHDDYANAVCGALCHLSVYLGYVEALMGGAV